MPTEPRVLLIADGLNAAISEVNAAMMAGDADWLRRRARLLASAGCDVIDVCAASVAGAEAEVLEWALQSLEPFVGQQLSIDSADPAVLEEALRHRSRPALVNSIDATPGWPPSLLDSISESGSRVVVQCRRGSELPINAAQRVAWADAAVTALADAGIDAPRILVDMVALPWGADREAGRGLLDAVEEWSARGSGARSLVAVSNLGWGHHDRRRLQREWFGALLHRGLGAALLDASDRRLMEMAGREEP